MIRRPAAALTTLLAAVLLLAGCGSDEPTSPPSAGQSTAQGTVQEPGATGTAAAPAPGAELDAAAFAAALEAPDTVVLDVRTPEEFSAGHLPGAVNLNVESPDFVAQLAELDPSVPYAVYCRSGNRSQVAVDLMTEAGFTRAYHLAGGIGAWQQAGGQVVTGD